MARSRATTNSGTLGNWQRLLATLAELPPGLAHLEPLRNKLTTILGRAVDVTKLRDAFTSDKQQFSQELKQLFAEGERAATALRTNVREFYGPRSEKLAAFGMQPFRSRNGSASATEQPVPNGPEIAAPPDDKPKGLESPSLQSPISNPQSPIPNLLLPGINLRPGLSDRAWRKVDRSPLRF